MPKAKKKVAKKKVVKKPVAKKKVVKKVVKKVRCAAMTKDGKRCQRMIVPPAKFCHLHKNWKPGKPKAKAKAKKK